MGSSHWLVRATCNKSATGVGYIAHLGSEVGGRDLLFIHGNNYLPWWLLVKEGGKTTV